MPVLRAMHRKARVFWPLLFVVLLADCTTKRAAVESLAPAGEPHRVVGDAVRFTLAYNERGAMGLPVGPIGREILGLLAVIVSMGLFMWYRRSSPEDTSVAATAGLLIAGALGNAWQRILSPRGVVDFIDVGWGTYRFWTFNVADVAISAAACLLLVMTVREHRETDPLGTPVE